jgi:hypothetical protein
MAKRDTSKLRAELEARGVNHNSDATYDELKSLLDDEVTKEQAKKEVKSPVIEYKQVPCGASTVNDHERRITILEAKLAGK